MGTLWGYARSSTGEQIDGPQVQADRIRTRAAQLTAKGEGVLQEIFLEHESAEKVPYLRRIQFKRLLDRMKNGDTLILCWLNRLERHPLRMVSACEHLARRGIRIIELTNPFTQGEIDLSTTAGRSILLMHATFVNYDSAFRSDATKAGMARAKGLGRKMGGDHLPFGHRVAKRQETEYIFQNGKQIPVRVDRKYLTWDVAECQLLVELVMRHRLGETIAAIARDWHKRELRRSTGLLWSPKAKTGKKGQVLGKRLYQAYQWAEEEIAEKGNIGGIEMPPKPEPAMPEPKELPPSKPRRKAKPKPSRKSSLKFGKAWWKRI